MVLTAKDQKLQKNNPKRWYYPPSHCPNVNRSHWWDQLLLTLCCCYRAASDNLHLITTVKLFNYNSYHKLNFINKMW